MKRIFSLSSGTRQRLGMGLAMFAPLRRSRPRPRTPRPPTGQTPHHSPQQGADPSGTLAGLGRNPGGEHRNAPPGPLDLLPGTSAEGVGRDVVGPLQLPHPQELHRLTQGPDEAMIPEGLRGHRPGLDPTQVPDVDDLVLHPVDILEAPLWKAALEGHLATLEPGGDRTAGTGALSLVASSGGLSVSGPRPPSDALAVAMGARSGAQIMQLGHSMASLLFSLRLP